MPLGNRVKPGNFLKKMESLDIDEGIRIESKNGKIFINKNSSGKFVVQVGDTDEFYYFDAAKHVKKFIKDTFRQYEVWMY